MEHFEVLVLMALIIIAISLIGTATVFLLHLKEQRRFEAKIERIELDLKLHKWSVGHQD